VSLSTRQKPLKGMGKKKREPPAYFVQGPPEFLVMPVDWSKRELVGMSVRLLSAMCKATRN